ncbi:hypothetical protein JQX13_21080 [Archangium violaceum]|uniref:primase-helicase family protein n=1 Tax=Archangium violaceum TaxID=83451 RepID=UPI00193BEE8A|nr:primase-helicase family protein [Archangium violaceum]QRK12296.1 hypothetical protein JQX13_21080 [Archangium violaceum]
MSAQRNAQGTNRNQHGATRQLLRAIVVDPVYKAMREQVAPLTNCKLLRVAVESIIAAMPEEPELGRTLCHLLLCTKWTRKRRASMPGNFAATIIDSYVKNAREAVAQAQQSGSLKPLAQFQHIDEEFEALGLTLPARHVKSSPQERVEARLGMVGEDDIMKHPPEDFLFDARECKWYQLNRRGEWMGPYSDTAFSNRLLKLGLPRPKHDVFKMYVEQYDRAEPLFDTRAKFVKRNGEGIRNTYVRSPLVPERGTWFRIWRVLLNLVGGNYEHLEYLLDWLAAPLQSLHFKGQPLKMGTAIIFHGDEGSGKGTLERIICLIYGRWNVALLGQNALESRFHEQLVDKLFVVANEVISSTNRSAETQNLLKPWVTDEEIPLEAKHKAATKVPNRFNIIFTSNDEKPVIVPKKDRRYTVFKTGLRLPQKLSEALYADLDGPQLEVAAFYWHLLHRKVRVKVGQVLDTEARREVQAATASSDEKFVAALKQEGWWALSAPWADEQHPKHSGDTGFNKVVENTNEGDAVLTSRLSEVYQHFCRRNALKARDSVQLAKTVKAEVPGARSKQKKLGGVPRQMWFGLPMMPPETKADVIPLPMVQQAPVERTERPAESAVDDADFGTDAA